MGRQRSSSESETAGVATVTPAAPSFSVPIPRPVREIVEDFWKAISTHPDARILFIDPPGSPEPSEAIRGLPLTEQSRLQLKFVYKK